MASVFPLASYFTKHVALADNTLDTVYICGEQGELAFDITWLAITATTANADTASLYHTTSGTDWCLVYRGPVPADSPLQFEGLPIHMAPGDMIKAQATAGATHTLHVHITGIKMSRAPKAEK